MRHGGGRRGRNPPDARRAPARRAGKPLSLRRIVVRDPNKSRGHTIPRGIIGTDLAAAINDPAVHVVVELIGGTTVAKKVVLDALAAGKHVVTANKALLADSGTEVFEAARRPSARSASRRRSRAACRSFEHSAKASPPTRSRRSRAS